MARIMSKIVPVKVVSEEINCYATIQRSMLAAVTACLRLGNDEKMDELNEIRRWASDKFDSIVASKTGESDN